jgi:hypothetical protein
METCLLSHTHSDSKLGGCPCKCSWHALILINFSLNPKPEPNCWQHSAKQRTRMSPSLRLSSASDAFIDNCRACRAHTCEPYDAELCISVQTSSGHTLSLHDTVKAASLHETAVALAKDQARPLVQYCLLLLLLLHHWPKALKNLGMC